MFPFDLTGWLQSKSATGVSAQVLDQIQNRMFPGRTDVALSSDLVAGLLRAVLEPGASVVLEPSASAVTEPSASAAATHNVARVPVGDRHRNAMKRVVGCSEMEWQTVVYRPLMGLAVPDKPQYVSSHG